MTYIKDKRNKQAQAKSAQSEPKKSTKGKPEYIEGEKAAQNFEASIKSLFTGKKTPATK